MAGVTIPCSSCSDVIRFGDPRCKACGATVTQDSRRALEERLEASHAEYREFKELARSAKTILVILALGYFGVGTLQYFMEAGSDIADLPESLVMARMGLLANYVIAAVLVGCIFGFRVAPALSLVFALSVWVAVNAITTVASFQSSGPPPIVSIFLALVVKLLVFVLLVRGTWAAFKARRLHLQFVRAQRGG